MPRPQNKKSIKANFNYLKKWDEYQRVSKRKLPILLPISVDIKNGIIDRHRIKSTEIAVMRTNLMMEFKGHCQNPNGYLENKYHAKQFEEMIDDYIKFFIDDAKQGAVPPGPLDLNISRPVWILYALPRKNWKFTKDRQFSVENDRDDFARNFEKIMTFDKNNMLLLANHCRSNPKGLKFNLHVTISQRENGRMLRTPIIIDPGTDNGTRGGPGQQGLP